VFGDVVPDEAHGIVLDVGHGSAAVFFDGDEAIVVDAGSAGLVADTLERQGVTEIAALILSHRHHDHTSEVPSLLSNKALRVRRLFVNADPTRNPSSRFEEQLYGAWNDSYKRNKTELHQANVTLGTYMSTKRLTVDVLSPDGELTWKGVGAKKASGGKVHPHELAVVLRVRGAEGGRAVLFGADLDRGGFQSLIDDAEVDLSADVLVYPHHGGLSKAGSEAAERAFAMALTEAVGPEVVLFSNGRGSHPNPRREVVQGVRSADVRPLVRIVCTQLSEACSPSVFPVEGRLDDTLGSAGADEQLSCAGSVRVALDKEQALLPMGARHMSFVIDDVGEAALCAVRSQP
jgi:competence protein ComEC